MSIKSAFLLIALIGFICIIFLGVPVVNEERIYYIGLFTESRNVNLRSFRDISM